MAEFRSGDFTAAEQAFLAAEKGARENQDGPCAPAVQYASAFYRVMIMINRGKQAESATLFAETKRAMKPLPSDENNPFVDGASYEDLITWLAFKETQALLNTTKTAAN